MGLFNALLLSLPFINSSSHIELPSPVLLHNEPENKVHGCSYKGSRYHGSKQIEEAFESDGGSPRIVVPYSESGSADKDLPMQVR